MDMDSAENSFQVSVPGDFSIVKSFTTFKGALLDCNVVLMILMQTVEKNVPAVG